MTRFDLAGPLMLPASIPQPQISMKWRITHPVSTSVATDPNSVGNPPADAVAAKTATSYAGSLYGKSGSFVCGGTDDCQVEVTPTYAPSPVNGRHALQSVAVVATGTGGTPDLFFKPSGSPTLELYTGGPVGADSEYMVYGYWREDPTSAASDYLVDVFAQAFNTNTGNTSIPNSFTATYDGTAVGMYVEQDPNNAVDTHRQGEFTADVFLEVSNAASTTIRGTIDDFVTTPTDGSAAPRTSARWVVRLLNTPDTDGNTAVIDNLTGIKSGGWESQFVHAHQYATDNTPPAVTGTFNTRILDFVHLLGAFGAEKR